MESNSLTRRIVIWCLLMSVVAAGLVPAFNHDGWVAVPIGIGMLFLLFLAAFLRDLKQMKGLPDGLIEALDHENLADIAKSKLRWAPEASKMVNRIEQLVAQREQDHFLMQQIVDNTTDGFLCYNDLGKVMFVNRAFLHLAGVESILTIKLLQKKSPRLFDQLLTPWHMNPVSFVFTNQENEFHLQLSRQRFQMHGEWDTLAVFTDISQGVYRREGDSWRRLLSILNHEIANSVAPVSSLAKVLAARHSSHSDDLADGLGVIVRRVEGLMFFAQQVRNFSKVPDPVKQHLDLGQLVSETVLLMRSKAPDVAICFKTPDVPVFMMGDVALLQQLIINLVQNGFDAVASVASPLVEVFLTSSDGVIRLTISDNGLGVDPLLVEDIFVPFYTTRPKGSGIGLSLSRDIALKHGGKLWLALSEPGSGASFVVSLPGIDAGLSAHSGSVCYDDSF